MVNITRLARLFLFVIAFISLSIFSRHQVYAGSCSGPVPPAPSGIWVKSGPGAGEVTLSWSQSAYATRYAVVYGTSSGNYVYGAQNIGGAGSSSYTVKSLKPGTKYFFRLAAATDSCSSPLSSEVSAIAASNAAGAASNAAGAASNAAGAGGGMMVAPTPEVTVGSQPIPLGGISPTQSVFSGPVGKQALWAKSGPGVGQVTLYWKDADSADNYHLVYGTERGKFQYGALNIGKLNSFTVKSLTAGKVYYFALVPLFGGRPLYTTDQVSAVAWLSQLNPEPEPVSPSTSSKPYDSSSSFGPVQDRGRMSNPAVNIGAPQEVPEELQVMDRFTPEVMMVEGADDGSYYDTLPEDNRQAPLGE